MNNTGPSPLEIVLWFVLASVLLVASFYGAVQWMRRKATSGLLLIEEQLQLYDQRVRGILDFLQSFGSTSAEPFLTPIRTLSQDTQDIAVRLQDLDDAGQNLRAEIEAPSPNQMQNIINSPFNWLRRWQTSRKMLAESASIDTRLAEIEQEMLTINELPWQVALQIRQANAQVAEMARLAQSLQKAGAQGNLFQSAGSRVPIAQRSLTGIPAKFFDSGQNELLASAGQVETIQAFESLSAIRPIIDHWLPYLKDWDQSQQKAAAEFTGIQQVVSNLRRAIAQPPSGLKAEPIQERLNQITAMSGELEKRLSRPEVDQLKNLMREATRIRRLAEDAGQQLNRAGERAASLNQALNELKTALENLQTQYKSQEEKASHPLIFDESKEELKRLQQGLNILGPAGQARIPDQISTALDKTAQIRARHQGLAEKYQKVLEQYQALVALIESADLKDGSTWILKTREMIAQADVYDPHHWAKLDTLEAIKADLVALSGMQERVVPAGQAVPVKETRLGELLKEAQQLAELHKTLRPRVETTRVRLEKIQALEKEGKNKLTSAWNVLERASILTNDNEVLRKAAEADIKRQTDELKRLSDDLNSRGQGLIEKKIQAIQAQNNAVLQAIQNWMARLDAENTAVARQINERLAELDNIASLEDAPFQEARRLISSADVRLRPSATGPLRNPLASKLIASDQDLSGEMKRKNDLWHSLLGASQALEEKSAPVFEAYRETIEARTQAQSLADEAASRLAQRRSWPPTNQQPMPENQGIAPIDARWDAMRKQHVRTDYAILELGRLASQYQALSERAAQLIDRITQDQDRIYELEEQVEDIKQRWTQHTQSTPDNAILLQGVQQLLSRTDSQMAYIRQQYMRGAITYADVQKSLRLLMDEILTARVPVDENHDTGLPQQRPRDQRAR